MIYDCKVLSTIQCIKYEKLNDQFTTDSKGNDLWKSPWRDSEESKIECARRHIKTISYNGQGLQVAIRHCDEIVLRKYNFGRKLME